MVGKIGFVIVGLGYIGKRHADMIFNNPSCELIAVVETNEKVIADYIENSNNDLTNIKFFKSLDDMVNQIDMHWNGTLFACICTPNGLHYKQSVDLINCGFNLIIEKPVALSKGEAEHLVQLSIKNRVDVHCVMQNRYSPPSKWLKEVVSSGKLGEIHMVQVNCYWNRDERYYLPKPWKGTQELDGGTLFTQFSHFIDIMYWVFGDITNIDGKFRDFNHQNMTEFEDSGIVTFDFVKGGMGVLNYSTAVYNSNLESSITIIGENGSIKIGGQYMNEVLVCNIKDYEMPDLPPSNPPNDYGYYKGSASNHHHIYEDIVRDDGFFIKTTIMEGYKVVDIIDRIYKKRNENDFDSILHKKQ